MHSLCINPQKDYILSTGLSQAPDRQQKHTGISSISLISLNLFHTFLFKKKEKKKEPRKTRHNLDTKILFLKSRNEDAFITS